MRASSFSVFSVLFARASTVAFFGLVACLVSACPAETAATPDASADAAPAKRWSVLRDGLDRIPVCVWGSGPGDVLVGGGGFGSGGGALLMRWNGAELVEVPIARSESLWWLHGTSATDVWVVGEKGLALHGDGKAFTPVPTGTTATLYGVWAAAPNDVWAVGGTPSGAGPSEVLLHYDGAAWKPVDLPPPASGTLFKVWGRSASEVYVVGQGGSLRYDGSAWTREPRPGVTLFTVHGGPRGVFAIGGPPPTLLRREGAAWAPVRTPEDMSGVMSGVFVASDAVHLVGERHQRFRFDGQATFTNDSDEAGEGLARVDLHGVWADSEGVAFAVGGNYMMLASPGTKPRGTVLRYGR